MNLKNTWKSGWAPPLILHLKLTEDRREKKREAKDFSPFPPRQEMGTGTGYTFMALCFFKAILNFSADSL